MGDHQQWKWVTGFEKYAVSANGEIRRKAEISERNGKPVLRFGNTLKLSANWQGYKVAHLYIFDGCKTKKSIMAHRVVAMAFIPNPEMKPHINHINGVKDDNRVENLEWVTRKENQHHAVINGLYRNGKGENHNMAKLSNDDVIEIKRLKINNVSTKDLAEKYNVSETNINNIASGRSWKHIKLD